MKCNFGKTDKTIRIIAGLVILALGWYLKAGGVLLASFLY